MTKDISERGEYFPSSPPLLPMRRRDKQTRRAGLLLVPVIFDGKPLMPTIPSRARRWIKSGRATPFFSRGVFCVRLNSQPSGLLTQPVAIGIDPGSKKEGFTVKSKSYTFLNVQADAVTWVKKRILTRRQLRRSRRFRNCPYRRPSPHRKHHKPWLPPSTRARWSLKLRVLDWLRKIYPISIAVVEDVSACTKKGKRKWNASFSPLEVGKKWFYGEIERRGLELKTLNGYETKERRDFLGLKKSHDKLSDRWDAHCIDSWVLARDAVGGDCVGNKTVLCITPFQFHRRQLYKLMPGRGGVRVPYGGTISLGIKRGTLVRHPKIGLSYVGGSANGRLSLHSLSTGLRITQTAEVRDCKQLALIPWRTRSSASPALKI